MTTTDHIDLKISGLGLSSSLSWYSPTDTSVKPKIALVINPCVTMDMARRFMALQYETGTDLDIFFVEDDRKTYKICHLNDGSGLIYLLPTEETLDYLFVDVIIKGNNFTLVHLRYLPGEEDHILRSGVR